MLDCDIDREDPNIFVCQVWSLGEEGEDDAAGAKEGQGAHQIPLAAQAVQGHHEDEAGQGIHQGCQVKVEEDVSRDLG